MAKIKPIALSFKNNDEDRKLYEWISSKSNFSGFIKDILREKMEEEGTGEIVKSTKEVKKEERQLLDLTGFDVE